MFGGVQELSIDSKGRLAVPAKFRDVLLRQFTPMLVITLDSRHRLLIYPEQVWEKEAERILAWKLPSDENTAENKKKIMRKQNLLLHNAETVEVDGAGRVLLPANLRKWVQFEKEVTLVGHADHLELWDRERWEEEMNAALDDDVDELSFD